MPLEPPVVSTWAGMGYPLATTARDPVEETRGTPLTVLRVASGRGRNPNDLPRAMKPGCSSRGTSVPIGSLVNRPKGAIGQTSEGYVLGGHSPIGRERRRVIPLMLPPGTLLASCLSRACWRRSSCPSGHLRRPSCREPPRVLRQLTHDLAVVAELVVRLLRHHIGRPPTGRPRGGRRRPLPHILRTGDARAGQVPVLAEVVEAALAVADVGKRSDEIMSSP